MSDAMAEYRSKRISADDAAAMVRSGSLVDFGAFSTASHYLDAALAKRAPELTDIVVRGSFRFGAPYQVFEADSSGRAFTLETLFLGPLETRVPAEIRSFVPAWLVNFENLYRRGDWPSDYAAIMVSPPDEEGYLHFSPSPCCAKGVAETTGCFFAEINEHCWHVKGSDDRRIHVSKVDYIIEGDSPPLAQIPDPVPTEVDRKIASHILMQIQDGSCLQIGYGTVPMAVVSLIADSDLKDLGIHTELFADGMMKLCESGKVTNARKTIDKGIMPLCIMLGTERLYHWAKGREDLYFASSNYTNHQEIVGAIENMVTINACLEVDLSGQSTAESIGPTTISGSGGQLDFVHACYMSETGKSIVCCPSTYMAKDGTVRSRISVTMTPGSTVTVPRACAQYVATEYGIANLRGKSLWKRAEMIVEIAHPDFREGLIAGAEKIGVWRRSNRKVSA